jgi:hypothetical protein
MGELIEGMWHRGGVEAVLSEGALRRPPSAFRNWIVSNGSDPVGAGVFVAERNGCDPDAGKAQQPDRQSGRPGSGVGRILIDRA